MSMRYAFQWILAIVFLFLFTGCEHKELCFNHTHYNRLRVEFNWSRIADHDKPEGMRVVFFSLDGTEDPWIFDFPNNEGRTIELPGNDYGVISYNYDTSGIIWENNNNYTEYTATTRDVLTPEEEQARTTPSWLCGDHIDLVQLKSIPTDTEQTITLYPADMVCRYTYEVKGIRGIERVSDVRASLSDMSGSLLMAGDRLPYGLSENILFNGTVVDGQVKGEFYTFGCCQGSVVPNVFKLYIKSQSGKTSILEQDVSEQVHAVPVSGHIGNVHIIINLDFEVPVDPSDGDNTGFDVGVDDWTNINEDIMC